MHQPKLMLLDEPTSGLDPLVQKTVLELVKEVKESGSTVFFSSHVLAEVQSIADRVAIIKNGEIVEVGVTSSLLSKRIWKANLKFKDRESSRRDELNKINGVSVKSCNEVYDSYVLTIQKEVDPLVIYLANKEVDFLEINKPDLEEIFLSYYGDQN